MILRAISYVATAAACTSHQLYVSIRRMAVKLVTAAAAGNGFCRSDVIWTIVGYQSQTHDDVDDDKGRWN
jgi:hypothetical protein